MKVLLESKGGQKVEFSPATAEYMIKNGWKRVEQKPKAKPSEAKK